ncbi:hypothetical protein [Falsiroseomonas sp. E2-1-a20]|uniref:hypothetical protein n=1 Tax=Falsiroseomonas sp. E2-1-a20 TaxID=3239300 RepID=UPI003F41256E
MIVNNEILEFVQKVLRSSLDNPETAEVAFRRARAKMISAGKSSADFSVAALEGDSMALLDSITQTYQAFGVLARNKGLTTEREIANALGEDARTVRDMKRSGYVPLVVFERLSRLPDRAPEKIRRGIDYHLRAHRRHPDRYRIFVDYFLRQLEVTREPISYLTVAYEMRRAGHGIDEKVCFLYAKTLLHERPDLLPRFKQRTGGQGREWEEEFTPEKAAEVLSAVRQWQEEQTTREPQRPASAGMAV